MYEETAHYWRRWVRNLAVPFEWQEEVIRAAITLKLNTITYVIGASVVSRRG